MAADSGSSTANANNDAHTLDDEQPEDENTYQRPQVRSIPPWVVEADPGAGLLSTQPLEMPEDPVLPHHQYMPEDPRKKAPKGRRFDPYRTAEPAMLDQTLAESSLRWLPFMVSGPRYAPRDVEGARLMPDDWMEENVAWWSGGEEQAEPQHEKRRTWLLDLERRRGSVSHAKVRSRHDSGFDRVHHD